MFNKFIPSSLRDSILVTPFEVFGIKLAIVSTLLGVLSVILVVFPEIIAEIRSVLEISVPLGVVLLIVVGEALWLLSNNRVRKSALGKWRVFPGKELEFDPGMRARHNEAGQFVIDLTGSRDRLIYGPYRSLPSGKYRAVFRMKLEGQPIVSQPFLMLDVRSDTARKLHAMTHVSTDELSTEQFREISIDFELFDKVTNNLEFRLGIAAAPVGVEKLVFDYLTVEKLNS